MNLKLCLSFLFHVPGFDARDHVGWAEGELFDLCKVVGGVPVEHQLAQRLQGELTLRPDLREKAAFRIRMDPVFLPIWIRTKKNRIRSRPLTN